jgi:carnitine 3-dehydrogenase
MERGSWNVRRVACVGAGVIGGGWVAHFLARGYDVTAWDPAPDAARKLRRLVDAAWPTLTRLGLAEGASTDRLTVTDTLEQAVAHADFVQESAPEQLDLKRDLLARLDAATPPGVVIASSTSGYPMTDMQTTAADPTRLVVGHPFNPPYLIPLVEVVGGERTDAAAVARAARFYEVAGKSVIRWTKRYRGSSPELGKELYDAVVAGCDEAADGRSLADLVAERDRGVVEVLRATGRLDREEPAR